MDATYKDRQSIVAMWILDNMGITKFHTSHICSSDFPYDAEVTVLEWASGIVEEKTTQKGKMFAMTSSRFIIN